MRRIHTGSRKSTFMTAAAMYLLMLSLTACGAAETDGSAAGNTEQDAAVSAEQNAITADNTDSLTAAESAAAAEQERPASRGMLVGETYADVCGQDGVEDAIRIWLSQTSEESELPEHGYNTDVVNYLTDHPGEYIWLEVYPGVAAEEGTEPTYAAEPIYERKISTDEEDQITVGLISRDGQEYLIEYGYYLSDGCGSYGYEAFWLDTEKPDGDNRVVAEECQYDYDLNALENVTLQSLTELSVFADYLSAEELERVTEGMDEVLPEVTVLARGTSNPADCRVLCGTETRGTWELLASKLATTIEAEYAAEELIKWVSTQLAENPDLWETAGDGVEFWPDDAWELNFTVWDDLLGYDHVLCVYRKHYEGSYETVYNFYQEDSGILTEIATAYSFGGDCATPYPEDLDGDGSAELLICDEIGGDGGRDVIVYRTAEDGTAQEASGTDLLDVDFLYQGIGSLWAEYLQESRIIRVHYNYEYKDYPLSEHYDRLEWDECWFG